MPVLNVDTIIKNWAAGQPVENLNALGKFNLDELARTCLTFLNENTSPEETTNILNALQGIIAEFRQRGFIKEASKYQSAYVRFSEASTQVAEGSDEFISQVYDSMVQICANNKAELDEIKSAETKLIDNKATNLIIHQLTLFDFDLFTSETNKNIKIEYFKNYYFTKNVYEKRIIDGDKINISGNIISAKEFAERLYWTNYNLWIIVLQTLLIASKISNKYSDSKVLLNNSYNKYNNTYQSTIYVDFPNKDNYIRQTLQVQYELNNVMDLSVNDIKERQFNLVINGESYPSNQYATKGKEFISNIKSIQ